MEAPASRPATVDAYMAALPANVRTILERMRKTVTKAAPKAEELISYNMPALRYKGMLVWYAAHKEHVGFYPTPSALIAFKNELTTYKSSKGAVQFPLDQPLPLTLIKQMVQFRIAENDEKALRKKKKP